MKGVFGRLLAGETHYDDLRPHAWKQSQPEVIRIYRAERQARADAKSVKRARRRIDKTG